MNISDLKSKNVGILGFGQEGSAIAAFLQNHEVEAKIFDKQPQKKLPEQYQTQLEHQKLDYFSGEDYLQKALETCQVIFRSPGVKLSVEMIELAKQNNVIITSQVEWFFEHSQAQIIGVTGTKGKGTTSSLIYEILKASNPEYQVFLTGNIGKIQPLEIINQLTENDVVVYELSSFQLEFLKYSPHIGVCLMVTEDHLDYHGDTQSYNSAKEAITKFQRSSDYAISNIDYPASKEIGELGEGEKWQISNRTDITTGAKIGEDTIQVWEDGNLITEFDCSKRNLRGNHNLENIAAAILVAQIIGIEQSIIQNSVINFQGLEHRLQLVRDHDGVKYYNDSISTIPETTIAALKSFTEPIVLLLGGATKKLDNTDLLSFLSMCRNLKSIICVGQTGQELHAALSKTELSSKLYGPFNEFEAAVLEAKNQAVSGDVVLLSPAATSYDMFENYKKRGEKFAEIISKF
jgi:UDP-N-acetylmuramoylalanine--D-glutamate ligase